MFSKSEMDALFIRKYPPPAVGIQHHVGTVPSQIRICMGGRLPDGLCPRALHPADPLPLIQAKHNSATTLHVCI